MVEKISKLLRIIHAELDFFFADFFKYQKLILNYADYSSRLIPIYQQKSCNLPSTCGWYVTQLRFAMINWQNAEKVSKYWKCRKNAGGGKMKKSTNNEKYWRWLRVYSILCLYAIGGWVNKTFALQSEVPLIRLNRSFCWNIF